MFKLSEIYKKKRLTDENVINYVLSQDLDFSYVKLKRVQQYLLPKKDYHFSNEKWLSKIGFNYETIRSLLDRGHSVILTMLSDGRGYYICDSVFVVGYAEFILFNRDFIAEEKLVNMLIVYDEIQHDYAYLDPNKISVFSKISY